MASLFIAFFIGVWVGLDADIDIEDNDLLLHCYECEIEMPVKEKNGKLFCSNCGLCH